MKLALPLTAGLVLAGCVTSPVTPLDGGDYLVAVHTFFGVSTPSALVDHATAQAVAFCSKRGETAQLVKAVGTGVPGLTNLSSDVVFRCVAAAPPPSASN